MQLREYMTSDCDQLARLFFQTVHSVNAKDYTKEQLVRTCLVISLQTS